MNILFSEGSKIKLSDASLASGMSAQSIIINGAIKYAETLISAKKDNRTPTDVKIHNLVTDTMQANEAAVNWWDKIEITKGWIAKVTGSNRKNINNYIDSNKATIDAHHAKCGIEPDHNRRVFNFNRMQPKNSE